MLCTDTTLFVFIFPDVKAYHLAVHCAEASEATAQGLPAWKVKDMDHDVIISIGHP